MKDTLGDLYDYGQSHRDAKYMYPMVIMKVILIIFGSLFNFLVLIVIGRLKSVFSGGTATYIFIAGLATSDLANCLINLPMSIFLYFYTFHCAVENVFQAYICATGNMCDLVKRAIIKLCPKCDSGVD
ncbi:hypothetical protein Ciccas_008670 [Cichlidogyrus casuarinus]|uniref:G-protein coupled receptors family 1 profile domain-containing protein n=1 Tax=Cichlidogyrus casuarinus TaxID=1844966 RepID=A0ABD2Q052_9PLAT